MSLASEACWPLASARTTHTHTVTSSTPYCTARVISCPRCSSYPHTRTPPSLCTYCSACSFISNKFWFMQGVTIYFPMWGSWLFTAWCYLATYSAVTNLLTAREQVTEASEQRRPSRTTGHAQCASVSDGSSAQSSVYSATLMEIRMKVPCTTGIRVIILECP